MHKIYKRDIELSGPLSWPKDVSPKRFVSVSQGIMNIISQHEPINQSHLRAHIRGTTIQNLEGLEEYARSHDFFEGADIHFHTESVSCAISTRRSGQEFRDTGILWGSGIALGAGIIETTYGNSLEITVGAIAATMGAIGSIYGLRQPKKKKIKNI